MTRISRRNLARYAAEQLLRGNPVGKLAKEVFSVLIADKRPHELELLVADIHYELESSGHVALTQITSATQLSEKLHDEIKTLVKKSTGVDRVSLDPQIDKSVIGGLRIETATQVWDKTVSNQLNNLKEAF